MKTICFNIAVFVIAIYVGQDQLIWLSKIAFDPKYITNAILSTALILYLLKLLFTDLRRIDLRKTPSLDTERLLLLLATTSGMVFFQNYKPIATFACSFYILFLFALYGTWCSKETWSRVRPFALLAVLILPFQNHLDVYLGFPLRKWVAQIASLATSQVVSAETILTVESRSVIVDLPCAGIKSLWSYLVFVVSCSVIGKFSLDRRWVFMSLVGVVLLITANIGRVLLLSWLILFGSADVFADIIHVPIGVLGFGIACFVFLIGARNSDQESQPENPERIRDARMRKLAPVPMLCCLLVLLVSHHNIQAPGRVEVSPFTLSHPQLVPADLHDHEISFFSRFQGSTAGKYTFSLPEAAGSLLLYSTIDWRGHHSPEECFSAWGIEIAAWNPASLDLHNGEKMQLRVGVDEGGETVGFFWFQNGPVTTGDFAERIWRSMGKKEEWTLVSVFLDRSSKTETTQFRDITKHVYQSILSRQMLGESI